MKKKRLLLIVPTLKLGGQERVAVNTAEIMADEYEVTLAVFSRKDVVYDAPCEVIDLDIPAALGKWCKVRNALRRATSLQKIKNIKKIDYALSFGHTANLANVLSGNTEMCFLTIRDFESVTYRRIDSYLYQHCCKIACVSKVIAAELSRLYHLSQDRVFILYNPYDLKYLQDQGNRMVDDYKFSSHTVVAHGRLEEVKNYPRLIKAFSLVREKIADAQLLIIGEGSQRKPLEDLISTYRLQDCATLIGFRKNPFAYLAKSTLYVLSSYSEGFPNALVEGMTFLPAVAVDCKTGPREILSDGPVDRICRGWEDADYGVLVQPADRREFCQALTEDDRILADAILWVLTNPQKAKVFQSKAQLRVEAFSYATYRKNIQKLLGD